MDGRNRLWNRLISRFRRNRSYYCYDEVGGGRRYRRRPRRQQDLPVSLHGSTRCNPFWQNGPRSRAQLLETPRPASYYFRQIHRNPTGGNYVPKCLSGVNFGALLLGTTSNDDFSRSCWLENSLHLFGSANPDDNDDDVDCRQSFLRRRSISPLGGVDLDGETTIRSSVSARGQRIEDLSGDGDCYSGDGSRSDGTVSDITRFYNSVNLTGFAFNTEEGMHFEQPPPYSEYPEDPPPPYTANFFTRPSRPSGSTSRFSDQASLQLSGLAILW